MAGALDLRVWCLWCARGDRLDPTPVLARFRARGWPIDLVAARGRFRCRRCGQQGFILLLPASRPDPAKGLVFDPGSLTAKSMGAAIWFFLRKVGKVQAARPIPRPPVRIAPAQPRGYAGALRKQMDERRRAAMLTAWRLVVRPPQRHERLTAALASLDDRPMCNRYQVRTAHAEAVQLALGLTPDRGLNYAGEVYPGYTGLVIALDDAGDPRARTMTWGFPLALTGKQGQPLKPRPVNNAREDKLRTWMWRDSFERRRCLIPASAWAEAEGEKGRMTCTWHALPDDQPLALAGIWRPTEEWGDAYAMVMVDGCPQMAEVHDRMPVILRPEHWRRWLTGAPTEALPLCETWLDELAIDRTAELWGAKRG